MSYGSEQRLHIESYTFCWVISALPVNNILHAMLRTTSNIIFMVNDKTSLLFLNSIVISYVYLNGHVCTLELTHLPICKTLDGFIILNYS